MSASNQPSTTAVHGCIAGSPEVGRSSAAAATPSPAPAAPSAGAHDADPPTRGSTTPRVAGPCGSTRTVPPLIASPIDLHAAATTGVDIAEQGGANIRADTPPPPKRPGHNLSRGQNPCRTTAQLGLECPALLELHHQPPARRPHPNNCCGCPKFTRAIGPFGPHHLAAGEPGPCRRRRPGRV